MALKELVETMAKSLVDRPEEVVVSERAHEPVCQLELRVGDGDIGKVIGREGRTAQSMRLVLQAAAQKLGVRAHLEIID